jgi:hypothetical protein
MYVRPVLTLQDVSAIQDTQNGLACYCDTRRRGRNRRRLNIRWNLRKRISDIPQTTQPTHLGKLFQPLLCRRMETLVASAVIV